MNTYTREERKELNEMIYQQIKQALAAAARKGAKYKEYTDRYSDEELGEIVISDAKIDAALRPVYAVATKDGYISGRPDRDGIRSVWLMTGDLSDAMHAVITVEPGRMFGGMTPDGAIHT